MDTHLLTIGSDQVGRTTYGGYDDFTLFDGVAGAKPPHDAIGAAGKDFTLY
jgi:hypothetical protein